MFRQALTTRLPAMLTLAGLSLASMGVAQAAPSSNVAFAAPPSGAAVTLVDLDDGRLIASASVRLVGAPPGAALTPLGGGAFSLTAAPGATVAIEATAPGYATATLAVSAPAAGAPAAKVRLAHMTPEVSAWLTQVNADRARAGVSTVTLDEALVEAARAHAAEMSAKGYFSHYDLGGYTPADRCAFAGAQLCMENLAYGQPDALSAQAAFMAERASCSTTCPPSAGHYVNLISPADVVGLGIASGAQPGGGPVRVRFYDQELALRPRAVRADSLTQSTAGAPVAVRFRVLDGHKAAFANWYHTTCAPTPFSPSALHAVSPHSPYDGACTTTTPTYAGVSLSSDRNDPNLVTVRGTPNAPGTWYLAVADAAGFLGVAAVAVR